MRSTYESTASESPVSLGIGSVFHDPFSCVSLSGFRLSVAQDNSFFFTELIEL